jgi:ribosomal protein S3AE
MALKKKFVEVELEIINDTLPILENEESSAKKTIKLDLSRKLKGRGVEVTFEIMKKDGKLVGYPKNIVLMKSYIQRMSRNRISFVEDSFNASCKDISVIAKPFLITRKKVSRAIRNNLRKTAKEFILNYLKEKTYLESARAIIFNDLQREMYPKLKKIYPLILCEIRVFETKELSKADLELKQPLATENPMEEKAELTQAEEYEAEQKKKLEEQKAEPQEESIPKEKKPRKNKKE